ncbi:MAG: hypothetical protein V3R93_08300 [Candidatus Hydrothermarchaeaceae archaeon]
MKYARISAKIPVEDKEKIKRLVEKGLFESMSEFHKVAARRLLKDLDAYAEKKKRLKKRVFERPDDRVIKEMKELAKFADDLY